MFSDFVAVARLAQRFVALVPEVCWSGFGRWPYSHRTVRLGQSVHAIRWPTICGQRFVEDRDLWVSLPRQSQSILLGNVGGIFGQV